VLLLNRRTSAAEMKLTWNDIGLTVSDAKVKDVWAGRELGELSAYSSQVPAGDAVLLLIRGTGSNATDYAVSSSSAELRGGATLELCKPCAAGHMVRLGGEREVRFNVPAFARPTLVEIHYLNPGPTDLMMQLRANGRLPTNILCASTGSEAIVGSAIIEIEPERSARQSTLVFSSSGSAGLALESIIVLPLGSSQ
jgi:Alpha galactosidase C-terminal beta sandwich domain